MPTRRQSVEVVFARCEAGLVGNEIATWEALFNDDLRTIRYEVEEIRYGMGAVHPFRRSRMRQWLERDLSDTVITTYGRDSAVAMTLLRRDNAPAQVGHQSRTWIRFPDGSKVVAAHISVIEVDRGTRARMSATWRRMTDRCTTVSAAR